ncbi:MAG: hypothetical protein AB7I37_23205 [Pirellulales bacterium]
MQLQGWKFVAGMGLALMLLVGNLFSQEPGEEQPPPPAAQDDPQEDVKPAGPVELREQTIYIPYAKLREVFETQGRGVFLPYDKFQELWIAAREKQAPAGEDRPPVEALITEAAHEAKVSRDVVQVEATIQIELLTEGWHAIPLYLADAAISSARINDAPARVVFDPALGYKLLIKKSGKEPENIELKLAYAKAISKSPGQNSVAFQAPRAPVSRWRVLIEGPGVKVNIHPLIAASEVPPADGPALDTVVLAFVGAAENVRIDWTPRTEGATGLEALATVQARQEVTIDEGVTRTRAVLVYDISRAELTGVVLEAPPGEKVVNVYDANVRQWNVEEEGEVQKISVEFFEPAKDKQSITVELERFTDDEKEQEVAVPSIKARGVGRQQGVVLVRIGPGLRGETIRRLGLLQTDLAEMGAGDGWTFAYRYAALPFDLRLKVEKIEPRIVVESLVEAWLEPDRLSVDVQALYTIERAGVFRLEWNLPAGYEVRSVRGHAVAGAEPVAVDGHTVEGDEAKRLVVNLSRKALGRVGLLIELTKRLDEPDLLSPTGKAATVAVPVPQVPSEGVERASGRVIVQAPQSLRVNPAKSEGLRSLSFAEAYGDIACSRSSAPGGGRPVLAFAFAQEPVVLELSVERRKPSVTARQLLTVRFETGVVKYESTFFYEILYSPVKTLRIDLPAELASKIHNDSELQEKKIDPAPADLADGYIAWELTGETELIGEFQAQFSWEEKLDKLEVGKPVEVKIPQLKAMGVDRAWGQVALLKAETLDVHESGTPRGLRGIDPEHDMMPGASVSGAARAFEFQEDWDLSVTATLYQLEEVKTTSIERAVVRMVLTRGGDMPVQALYRLRSSQQRLIVRLPAGAKFDSQPLHINGQAATLERGNQDEFFVPLVGQTPDTPFLLELRYAVPAGDRLDLPEFPADSATQNAPAVQKLYLCAYLPEEQLLLGSRGPWTDELRWVRTDLLHVVPYPNRSDSELINETIAGVPLPPNTNVLSSFATDGKLYTFSTMRPEPAPAGSLRLATIREGRFKAILFVGILVLGVVLLGTRCGIRVLAVGGLAAALVLIGVFLPTLSNQVLNLPLVAAMAVVGVMWGVKFIGWTLPKRWPWPAATARANDDATSAPASPFAEQPAKQAPAADPPPPSDTPADEKQDKPEGGPNDA